MAEGFAIEPTGEWSEFLTRGSSTKSLLLGAMAGKDFYLKFGLDFSRWPMATWLHGSRAMWRRAP